MLRWVVLRPWLDMLLEDVYDYLAGWLWIVKEVEGGGEKKMTSRIQIARLINQGAKICPALWSWSVWQAQSPSFVLPPLYLSRASSREREILIILRRFSNTPPSNSMMAWWRDIHWFHIHPTPFLPLRSSSSSYLLTAAKSAPFAASTIISLVSSEPRETFMHKASRCQYYSTSHNKTRSNN